MNGKLVFCSAVLWVPLAACAGISKAPKGSPRVELEVALKVAPSFTDKLEAAPQALDELVAEQVMSQADVGLRFYPVASSAYGPDDVRPTYLLSVEIQDLEIDLGHKTVEGEPGQDPTLVTLVKGLRCIAVLEVMKRREEGPALTVGTASQSGSMEVSQRRPELPEPVFAVRRDEGQQSLQVCGEDLQSAVRRAVESALKKLTGPIDRDLTLDQDLAAGANGDSGQPRP
jgi:hypothetical protein